VLCGRLHRTFPAGLPVLGAPDLIKKHLNVEYSLEGVPEDEKEHFTAWWDMHAFGAWLADTAAANGHTSMWARDKIVEKIIFTGRITARRSMAICGRACGCSLMTRARSLGTGCKLWCITWRSSTPTLCASLCGGSLRSR